jgi:LysR family transcriptional regulator, hca operon transcriptional activator
MAMSLLASERGVALPPISSKDDLPSWIVCRPLKGEQPKVDLMIGYRKDNASPILKTSLSRIERLIDRAPHSGAK